MKKFIPSMFVFSFIAALIMTDPTEVSARNYEEGDRYRPGICTLIDEEGPYDVAICTKKMADGPCINEVTCQQPTPE
jgi:hypothetical protein